MPRSEKIRLHQEQLRAAERHLSRRDPALRPFIRRHNPCALRPHNRHFETLVDAIVSQQLSTKVAEVILGRFKALYAPARFPTAMQILATPDAKMRAVGLSGGKVSFLKDLAAKSADGSIRFSRLARMSEPDIVEMLTGVKGIGTWTAQMFLIFSLGRLDVLPAGDLGIRKAIERLYGLDHLPDTAEIEEIADRNGWRPYCSVASWYLWRSWESR